MVVAILTSLLALTARGPVYMVQMVQTKDVGFCKTMENYGRNDPVPAVEVGAPSIIGCFGFSTQNGLRLVGYYMASHGCNIHPITHTFDEVTGLTDATYVCDKP